MKNAPAQDTQDNALYASLPLLEAPQGLYAAVMARIDAAERRAARIATAVFGFVALASAAALVPVAQYTLQQFYASGFYDYLSLALSDHSLALTYWREFGLSLVESLPSLALLMLIPVAGVLLWSLRRVVRTVRSGLVYAS